MQSNVAEDGGQGAPTLVLPIGHSLGKRHEDVPEGLTHVNQVRVGVDVLELADPEFGLWGLAHGTPGADGDPGALTETEFRAQAAAQGLTDDAEFARLTGALREQGLLATVAPGSPEAGEFARNYRLVPLALGLGTPVEGQGLFGIGLLYQPLVMLTPPLADLWQFSPVARDLWTACQESAAVADAAGVQDPDQVEPDRVLIGVLGALHVMLTSRVACLDVPLGVSSNANSSNRAEVAS